MRIEVEGIYRNMIEIKRTSWNMKIEVRDHCDTGDGIVFGDNDDFVKK